MMTMRTKNLTKREGAARVDAGAVERERGRLRSAESRARLKAHGDQVRASDPEGNPLLTLPEKERAKLFVWLRECPYDDAVQQMLREKGIEASAGQLNDFFQEEARSHWLARIERAAVEANALVQLVEQHPASFSSGILAALGQEAFRQIASGQAEPEAMNKMATLFMRAKADERADQLGELKREKMRQELKGQVGLALEALSEEVGKRPGARELFEALQREMAV